MTAQAKKPNRVDKKKALQLKIENNLSYSQIADMQHVHPTAVYRAIKDLLPDDDTKAYQDHRVDILAKLQSKLLLSLTDDEIKNMSAKDRITGIAILIDKEKLLQGHTGSIANYGTIVIMPQGRGNGDWSEDAKRLLTAPGMDQPIKQAEIIDVD